MILAPISASMFHLPVPLVEKILRPVVVYLVLVILLRVFGKRELAQINTFDLIVLLTGSYALLVQSVPSRRHRLGIRRLLRRGG